MSSLHPRMKLWLDVGEVLLKVADVASKQAQRSLRPKRRGSFRVRHPGLDTPMWNACAELIASELKPRGAKVRLARYLGVPKQRLSDYLKGRRRMPDAEAMLQILYWISCKRAGEDRSL